VKDVYEMVKWKLWRNGKV